MHKGYKRLSSDGKIYVFKDVIFNEIIFPYPDLFSTTLKPTNLSSSSLPLAFILIVPIPPTHPPSPNKSPIVFQNFAVVSQQSPTIVSTP